MFVRHEDNYHDDDGKPVDATALSKKQIYSTWIYLFLLITFIYILCFITLINPQKRTVTVSSLTPSLFNQLQSQYGQTLSCPCATVSTPYKTFVSHTISLHPVCSSDFVSKEWVNALYFPLASLFPQADIRTTAFSQFELLSTLCSISNETISDIVSDIDYYQLVSVTLLREDDVQSQVKASIDLARTSTSIEVTSFLYFLAMTYRSNQLVSSLGTNAVVYRGSDQPFFYGLNYPFKTSFVRDGFCAESNTVGQAFFISVADAYYDENDKNWLSAFNPDHYYYDGINPLNSTAMNGFLGGCFALDALFASELQCLYDSECLDMLPEYFPGFNQSTLKSINPLSHFSRENISTKGLVSNLFIDHWSTKVNYTTYFEQCAPSSCTYSTTDPTNFSYTITLFFGLYGGLTAILRLIAPLLINFILKLKASLMRSARKCGSCSQSPVYVIQWIKRLNLFKMATHRTADDIKRQRIITRCYLFFFACSVVILIAFTSTRTQTVTVVVSNPSLPTYKELQTLRSSSLECACSNSTMPYGSFVSISSTYHQICSSDLVSNEWVSILVETLAGYAAEFIWVFGSKKYFESIGTLCEFANQTANSNINNFLAQTFATTYVLIENDFNMQFNITINQFVQSIATSFSLFIDTMRLLMQVDQPLPVLASDISIIMNTSFNIYQGTSQPSSPFTFRPNAPIGMLYPWEACKCAHSVNCYQTWMGFTDQDNQAPGLVGGCYPIDTVLYSTLESFYANSTYFDQMLSYVKDFRKRYKNLDSNFTIYPLVDDPSATRFSRNTTLSVIAREMFIEQWNISFSFEQYYQRCSPSACKYTTTAHTKDLFGVLLTLISMIGGLGIALRITTPILVNSVLDFFKRKSRNNLSQNPSFCFRVKKMLQASLKAAFNLDIFSAKAFGRHTDRSTAKHLGRWSTRLYILLLAAALTILTFRTLISPETFTKTYSKPSLSTYLNLITNHKNNLQCPCSLISSPYNQFLQIQPQFHQICLSDFNTEEYRLGLLANLAEDLLIYSVKDYRRFFSAHFQFLQGLCALSIRSTNQAIQKHLSSLLVSSQLLTTDTFGERINQTINKIKSNAPVTFNRLISLIKMKDRGDKIVSAYGTNYQYIDPAYTNQTVFLTFTQPLLYDDNCSCALNSTCTINASFPHMPSETIQGLKMGCTASESFLASSFECFFNSSCIDLLDKMANFTRADILPPLNLTGSRFALNTTVSDLVNELFVENWFIQMNYSKYFGHCSPMLCSYTYVEQFNLIYTITYVLGLFGGLTIVLKWITPRMVSFLNKNFRSSNKHKNRVEPVSNIETTYIEINVQPKTLTNREPSAPQGFNYIIFYIIIAVIALVFLLVPIIYILKRRKD